MKYSLDTNVLVEAWNKYYALDLCPDYWEKINELALEGTIFATIEVKKDIIKKDDKLRDWVDSRDYLFRDITEEVMDNLRKIFEKKEYQRLIDSCGFRSASDPWVIAHAMAEGAIVVTKEEYETNPTDRIKIPNVCEGMELEWIDDFELIRRLGIKFSIRS